jgi:Tol biopolymer transport system component
VSRTVLLRRAAGAALAALALGAGALEAQYSNYFGKNKIQYRDFDWQIYHSPHFDLYYYEAEKDLLEKVASFAESAYDRLSREFDFQIQDPTPIIFYATHSAFEQNNIIFNFIPEGVGAFASPVRNRMVLPVDLPDGELLQLVMHELTHIFQYHILFQGKLGKGITSNPPQWFMEGMASYMAKDESTSDQMFLRDAVVNDRVPPIAQRGVSGFLAYRFGHAAFDFIEERWGKEGFRDFLYEFRNTFGSRADRALERAFRIEAEDFDLDFRRWLRQKYLPQLVATGEPSDFGRPFRDEEGKIEDAISPTASPSGDLVAALTVVRGDLDIVLYDARKRRPIANLTKGYSDEYQYLIAQHVTAKARMGRDLAFSPDGNQLAAFAKREKGRVLLLFDVVGRKLERTIEMDVEQQNGPAYSPDGRTIAFSGNRNGRFDIFTLDLASGAITNLTADDLYDGAPVFSPDGASIVYSATVGEDHAQLFRLLLAEPATRYRLTEGDWSDKDAAYSSDGKWLVFTSDRTGIDNIWALQLETGRTLQVTNAVTGCLMPTAVKTEGETDRVVYAGFWKGSFDLYLADLDETVGEPTVTPVPTEPARIESLPQFEPDIRVTLDEGNRDSYGGFKLFLEDGGGSVGVTDDQLFLGYAYLMFSDYLGDRRLNLLLSSVDTFSDFDIQYIDASRRWQWALRLFDERDYYTFRDSVDGFLVDRQEAFRQTGLLASWIYPFDLYHRLELGAGYIRRDYFLAVPTTQPGPGAPQEEDFDFIQFKDDFPLAFATFTGDSVIGTWYGPVGGRRWRLRTTYGYDTDEGGTLSWNTDLDWRQYISLSERTQLALRLFGAYAEGNRTSFYYIGGLDTLRGIRYRSLLGDRAAFLNLEFRFPLIDAFVGPFFDFRGIRGRVFLDVGAAWFGDQDFDFWNEDENRLEDGRSAYGWGLTVRFGGLDLNWDFSRTWDFKDHIDEKFGTAFWIGTRF